MDILWKGTTEPKIKCFKWLALLDILPIIKYASVGEYCSLCRLPKTSRHILFYYIFAKEIWNMFAIIYPINVNILEIITGNINGL